MRICDPPICHFLTNLIYHLPIKGEGSQYTQAAKLPAQSGPRGFLPEATKISDGYILNQD